MMRSEGTRGGEQNLGAHRHFLRPHFSFSLVIFPWMSIVLLDTIRHLTNLILMTKVMEKRCQSWATS